MHDPAPLQAFLSAPEQVGALRRFLEQLVEIPSGTHDEPGLERMQVTLAAELEALGFRVDRRDGGVLAATAAPPACAPRVLVVGHVDTVYPPGDSFRGLTESAEPGGPRMLIGPGAVDMKGGLAILVWALRALAQVGRLDAARPTVLLNRDEEIGSPASQQLIGEVAGRHDFALVLEPGFDRADGATTLVEARAGLARVELVVRGVEAHAGNQPERGLSAVATAARLVGVVDALADPAAGLFVKVCTIRGGHSINQVPGTATLGVDVRFRTLRQWETAHVRFGEAARSVVDRNTVTGQRSHTAVNVLHVKPPMPRLAGADHLLEAVLETGQALGQRLAPGRRNGTSDGNYTATAGTPTLDGMGVVGVGMHVAGGEAVRETSLAERAALLAGTLARLAAND